MITKTNFIHFYFNQLKHSLKNIHKLDQYNKNNQPKLISANKSTDNLTKGSSLDKPATDVTDNETNSSKKHQYVQGLI